MNGIWRIPAFRLRTDDSIQVTRDVVTDEWRPARIGDPHPVTVVIEDVWRDLSGEYEIVCNAFELTIPPHTTLYAPVIRCERTKMFLRVGTALAA